FWDQRIINPDNDVALAQTSSGSRTVGFDRNDKQSGINRQVVIADYSPVHFYILASHTDVAAPDFAVLNQPARDIFCGVDPDGKTEALCWENHGGVYADDFAARIDER